LKHAAAAPVAGPPAGVVDVWMVDLATADLLHDRLAEPLDADERRHAERMRVGGREWAAAHGALRSILASYLAVPAASLRFVRTPAGKPRLHGVAGLEFSFAHTEGLALVAVAGDRELGVDVEHESDRTDIAGVAREFLPEAAVADLARTPLEHRRRAFFAAWACHEASLKLRGQGLGEPLEADAASGDGCAVRSLPLRPGFAAAVAAEGDGWSVRMRRFDLHGN
jgi:4'-phosphopantetheinyl transferase